MKKSVKLEALVAVCLDDLVTRGLATAPALGPGVNMPLEPKGEGKERITFYQAAQGDQYLTIDVPMPATLTVTVKGRQLALDLSKVVLGVAGADVCVRLGQAKVAADHCDKTVLALMEELGRFHAAPSLAPFRQVFGTDFTPLALSTGVWTHFARRGDLPKDGRDISIACGIGQWFANRHQELLKAAGKL